MSESLELKSVSEILDKKKNIWIHTIEKDYTRQLTIKQQMKYIMHRSIIWDSKEKNYYNRYSSEVK